MRSRYFVLKFSIQMYVILSNFVYNKIIVIIARKEHILHKENKLSKFLIVINCNKYEKRVYFISFKAFCIVGGSRGTEILCGGSLSLINQRQMLYSIVQTPKRGEGASCHFLFTD